SGDQNGCWENPDAQTGIWPDPRRSRSHRAVPKTRTPRGVPSSLSPFVTRYPSPKWPIGRDRALPDRFFFMLQESIVSYAESRVITITELPYCLTWRILTTKSAGDHAGPAWRGLLSGAPLPGPKGF